MVWSSPQLAMIVAVAMVVSDSDDHRQRLAVRDAARVLDGDVALSASAGSFSADTLRLDGQACTDYHRALIRFDLREVDAGRFGGLVRATLSLSATEVANPDGREMVVAACTRPWDEGATWSTPNGRDAWPAREGHANIDYAMSAGLRSAAIVREPGVVQIDVTPIVERWLYQGLANDGFLLAVGGPVFGLPDAGTWRLAFAASESAAGDGPALLLELAGTPPSPATLAQRTLRWFPSPHLPPVRQPYLIYWDFGPMPRFPGSVSNAVGSCCMGEQEAAQRGVLLMSWFYGPQNPWIGEERGFVEAYENAARGGMRALMVDEWDNPRADAEPGSPLHAADPYGIRGSIQGLIRAHELDPAMFVAVAWRGESSIEPATRHGLPDLLMIEAYTHLRAEFPRDWGLDLEGIKKRIDRARELGMLERTIPWLGHIHQPAEYHEGQVLTAEILGAQIAELRAYAPQMPGIAFYANTNPALAEAADRAVRAHFVDPAPEVLIVEPPFESVLANAHATFEAEARPTAGRSIARFRWFVDNRLVAETAEPRLVWDLRGEHEGVHFITVHAVDDAYHRGAAQIPVRVQRGPD